MGVARLCRCPAYMKSAEDLLKRIFCLDIIVRGEHVEKCGFSPAPRTEEHVFEGILFQNRDEVGFIGNNGVGLGEEVGKLCVRWEKRMTAVLEHHHLDKSQEWKRAYNAPQRIRFRRWRLILEGVTPGDVSDSEVD